LDTILAIVHGMISQSIAQTNASIGTQCEMLLGIFILESSILLKYQESSVVGRCSTRTDVQGDLREAVDRVVIYRGPGEHR